MYDMIIIGAGPAGISMAIEAIAAGIPREKILVLEKGKAHCWSIRKFYPEEKLVAANYKGLPAVCKGVMCIPDLSKDETLSYLDWAIRDHGIEVHYNEGVSAIQPLDACEDAKFEVHSDRASYSCKVCVIAIGILGKPNKPDYRLPGKLRKQIHFDITSTKIEGQDVLVVGGGDSASEYCQFLVERGNRVTLSYRKGDFSRMTTVNRESLLLLEKRGEAELLRASNIDALEEQAGRVVVKFGEASLDDEDFDHVVYALGGTTPDNFLKSVGIAYDGDAPEVNAGYETSIPGLYLIGDLSPGGGSIILSFNSSREAIGSICDGHLSCPTLRAP